MEVWTKMVNNVNAQEWLDENYPASGKCQRISDSENNGKRREDITKLDLGKGKVGNSWGNRFKGDKVLTGSLKLEGFANLRTLIVSSHQLVSLDVSDCKNLVELDCGTNELNSLNVDNCSNLKKINFSNNKYIKELDLSTCPNLEEMDINDCPGFNRDTVSSNLNYDELSGKLLKGEPQITSAKEDSVRNILIVGITGNGKSALSNTLTKTNDFTESSASSSETKRFQKSDIFEYQSKKYRVIDNIGFGDTNNISEEEILFEIGEGIHEAKEGLNQVLFVFRDRFSPEHIAVFNSFEKFISKSGIAGFTTLIRTNFKNFRTQTECENDEKSLLSQNRELVEIIKKSRGIIHADNPPIPVIAAEDDDEEKQEKEQEKRRSEKIRNKSREKVLKHLAENCKDIYKLKEWDEISSMVKSYHEKKAEIERINNPSKAKELENLKKETGKGIGIRLETNVGIPLVLEMSNLKVPWQK